MSKKQDEEFEAIAIVFLIALVVGTYFWGWIGTILSFVLLFGMIANTSPSDSKKQAKASKPTKTIFELNEEYKKKEEEKKRQQLEKEMDDYGLDEDEKKLVRSGEYEPYQFEEEEPDEDDYYSEDN